ncbi:MAG: hypothetical protein ACRDLV_00460 [Solirubrobacteraceae bacterium]
MRLGTPKNSTLADTARIKAATRRLPDLDQDVSVLGQQPACSEPGCPPGQTVIAVLADDGGRSAIWRLHRPAAEIDEPALADPATVEQVTARIRAINAIAEIIPAAHAKVDLAQVLDVSAFDLEHVQTARSSPVRATEPGRADHVHQFPSTQPPEATRPRRGLVQQGRSPLRSSLRTGHLRYGQ